MTRLFRPFPTLLFAVAAFVAMGRSAQAQLTPQQKQEIHQHYDRATRAYDLGKYPEAVDEYQKVYEIDGDPVMLYNIAQAYRLNDQPQDAIHFYRRYLQRSPDARNREDVERKIASQEKVIEEKRKAAAAVQPPPIPTTPKTTPAPKPAPVVVEPPPPPPVVTTPPVITTPPPAPEPEPPSNTQRIVGWSMVGAGVAADVVAVIEAIVTKNRSDKLSNESSMAAMTGMPVPYDPTIQSEGKTANVIAIVCGIAGTAVAVAGGVVLITNGSSSSDAPPAGGGSTVSFTPWLGPGLAGGGVGLRY